MNSAHSIPPGTLDTLKVSQHDRDLAGLTYVYPVLSRRAGGVSVGINLNPNNACNWHCAYCQVPDLVRGKAPDIDLLLLEHELSGFLADLIHGDWMERFVPEGSRVIRDIAFSGNGEPTSAEVFAEAVDRVLRVRDAFGLAADAVPVRLITNGSLLAQARVQDGVRRLGAGGGEVWFKVDAGTTAGIERINGVRLEPAAVARNLARCAELCPTWVQTCVFRWDGAAPEEAELDAYLDVLAQAGIARLKGVLLYGVARPSRQPEAVHVSRLSEAEIEQIADRIRQKGLTVRVSP
ncbi:radical SAM protein [Thauera sp. AutoDN2]|jgi:wyosine [tRNA(Phe)-imidazoG37] synthetase (radical SAM superfamily)|uniref:radical SAM protein n=1 Tax=Thauera sp. AutoDN2 TaxID=3416051 RepID=UPI003F4B1606